MCGPPAEGPGGGTPVEGPGEAARRGATAAAAVGPGGEGKPLKTLQSPNRLYKCPTEYTILFHVVLPGNRIHDLATE